MRLLPLLLLLPPLAGAVPASPPPAADPASPPPVAVRPQPDRDAIREASEAAALDEGVGMASSASYAHAVRARLATLEGDHRRAVDELRLALVTDEDDPFLLLRLGEAHARLGEAARAERELRRALEKAPRSAEAHLALGRLLADEPKKRARARAHLRRAVALAPRDPEPSLALIELLLEEGALADAERVAEALGAALPGEPVGYRQLGLALVARGEAARAERLLRKAVLRDRGDVESLVALARLQEQAGRPVDAEASLAQALERDPDARSVLLDAGRLALRQGSAVRARAYFDRLLGLSDAPELAVQVAAAYLAGGEAGTAAEVLDGARAAGTSEPRLSFYAGLVHERLRRYEQAASAFAEVPAASSLYPEALARRALCLSRTGAHRRALDLLRQADAQLAGAPELVAATARVLERSGAVRQAERLLERALARRSPPPSLVEALAELRQRQGRVRESVALLERWSRRLPRVERLKLALAAAHARAGQGERAERVVRQLLRRSPDSAAALNLLGYTLADAGRALPEAERLVRRALALSPDTGAYVDTLGWVLYRRGDLAGALAQLQRAAELEPGEPVILEHLGDVLRDLGRSPEALAAYKGALEVLRGDPDAEAAAGPARRPSLERKLQSLTSRADGR